MQKKILTGSYTASELELSFLFPEKLDDIDSFLNELCPECEQKNESTTKRKWLFIVLICSGIIVMTLKIRWMSYSLVTKNFHI